MQAQQNDDVSSDEAANSTASLCTGPGSGSEEGAEGAEDAKELLLGGPPGLVDSTCSDREAAERCLAKQRRQTVREREAKSSRSREPPPEGRNTKVSTSLMSHSGGSDFSQDSSRKVNVTQMEIDAGILNDEFEDLECDFCGALSSQVRVSTVSMTYVGRVTRVIQSERKGKPHQSHTGVNS